MELTIRPLHVDELDMVVEIHLMAFPTSALTKLGKESIRRYYEWQMIGPHDSIVIGVFQLNIVIGFCVAGVFRGALGGFLQKNRKYLAGQVLIRPWLLYNPLFRERSQFALSRIFERMSRKTIPDTSPSTVIVESPKTGPSFNILAIAVSPQHQGGGAAALLMQYSERIASERGYTRMGLTVHSSNARAIRFYEKMGWQKDEIDGVWSGHMSKILTTDER